MCRIKFSKKSFARYISHLDLIRVFSRAFTRAEIPIRHTEGFNPHPHMVFSAPISLGFESECELLDIKLKTEMDLNEVKNRLIKNMPIGIEILDVYETSSIFDEIKYAEFDIIIDEKSMEIFENYIKKDEIFVEKKSKKGNYMLNIKSEITKISIKNNKINVIFPCGNEKNINPMLLMSKFFVDNPKISQDILIKRKNFFDQKMNLFL